MLKLKIPRRKKANIIGKGLNTSYELIKSYAEALTDTGNIYDYAWHTLYRYLTDGVVDVYDIRSKLNSALANPKRLADDYQKSTGVLILLVILENLNALVMDEVYSNLKIWLNELEKRRWFYWDKNFPPVEFISFSRLSRIVNPPSEHYEKIENEKPTQRNIRFLLYYYFALSLSNERTKAKSFIDEVVKSYKGIIFDEIINKDDIEYIALYMYLLAKFGYYSEVEEVYTALDKILIKHLVSANWILKAIKTARDIRTGLEDLDVIAISPEEIGILYPKILYLSLIAMYEAGYNEVLISTPELVRKLRRMKEENIVGVDPNFIRLYHIKMVMLVFLIGTLTAILSYIRGFDHIISIMMGAILSTITFIISYYFEKPKIIDLR